MKSLKPYAGKHLTLKANGEIYEGKVIKMPRADASGQNEYYFEKDEGGKIPIGKRTVRVEGRGLAMKTEPRVLFI